MTKISNSVSTLARETSAFALSYASLIAGLYALFLLIPFVRGEGGYVGVNAIRAIAGCIARATELSVDAMMAAAFGFGPVAGSARVDGVLQWGLYYLDGFVVCILAAATLMISGRLTTRILLLGWNRFLADVQSKGFFNAVAGSANN